MVDLGRRLMLTSGIILIGAKSNTQIFLGSLLCLIWLLLVVVRRPYVAYWDNVLSAVLSLQLVLIMLCGTALRMNTLTPIKTNASIEKRAFGILMVTFSIFIIMTSICSIIITIPCLRGLTIRIYLLKCVGGKTTKQKNEADVQDIEDETDHNETKNNSKRTLVTQTRMNSSISDNIEIDIEMTAVSIGGATRSRSKHDTNPFNKVTKNVKDSGERRITTKRLSKVIKARQNNSESKQ